MQKAERGEGRRGEEVGVESEAAENCDDAAGEKGVNCESTATREKAHLMMKVVYKMRVRMKKGEVTKR